MDQAINRTIEDAFGLFQRINCLHTDWSPTEPNAPENGRETARSFNILWHLALGMQQHLAIRITITSPVTLQISITLPKNRYLSYTQPQQHQQLVRSVGSGEP